MAHVWFLRLRQDLRKSPGSACPKDQVARLVKRLRI